MESERHCPTCLKPFQETNKLQCGHVFCSECISKTEMLAQKSNTNPECPVCLCEFIPASEENPHPNSSYHDELVSRSDSKIETECVDCRNEPTLICQDGCGFFCEDCRAIHSKLKRTASHKFITLLEAGNARAVNMRECILHNLPIISICNQCLPVSEMCSTCVYEDRRINKTHEYTKLEKIDYKAIKENDMIETVQKKINDIAKKKEKAETEMKKITREEEEQLVKIEQLYNDIVEKAIQLKKKLTELVYETFRPKIGLIESARYRIETSENIMKHSETMLKEAKEIYEREKIVTKLFKSAVFAKKVIELEILDVETIELGDLKEAISFSGDILIDRDGARLLDRKHETMKLEYEKCVQEIEQLKKTNDEWQKQMEGKDAKLRNVDERIQVLENKVAEYRKEKEILAQIVKQNEERPLKEIMGADVFNGTRKFNIKDYKFQSKIGSNGNGNQQFSNPWGIAVHPITGHIYIADYSNHRIQVLDEDLSFIRVFGSIGSGPGQFKTPYGISISLNGRIAVSENSGNRIQIFDENNTVITTIQSDQKKSKKCTQMMDFDGFLNPRDICFDAESNLYVTNQGKNRVDKFNRDFEFECSFAQSILGDTGIPSPCGVCMNSKNEVCVIGHGGNKIKFYNTDGTFIRSLRIQKAPNYVSIAEGPNNTILVSDFGNHVLVYDSTDGSIIHSFGSSKSSSADGKFTCPTGFCFSLNQRLYVCEYGKHRIQMFSP